MPQIRSTATTRRVGKGASRRPGLLARTMVRLCPRRPTSPPDRVGKVALSQCAISSVTLGDFAHPTTSCVSIAGAAEGLGRNVGAAAKYQTKRIHHHVARRRFRNEAKRAQIERSDDAVAVMDGR